MAKNNNIHTLCRMCYERMRSDRMITFAGGKTHKGVCASCGAQGNVARYNVHLDEPSEPKLAANGSARTGKRELPDTVRDRIREKAQQSAVDADKLRVMLTLHVDPRTCNTLAHMANNWGRSMDETVDIVVSRYRKSVSARYSQRTVKGEKTV